MKAAQRLEIYIAQDWIINVTKVNAFQASVANSLIDLGASIALALGDYEGGCKCSLRSTESFYLRTKMHLGKDVAQKIASECNGNGGGHSTAASFYTKYTIDDTLPLVLDVISKNLDIKIKKHHKN